MRLLGRHESDEILDLEATVSNAEAEIRTGGMLTNEEVERISYLMGNRGQQAPNPERRRFLASLVKGLGIGLATTTVYSPRSAEALEASPTAKKEIAQNPEHTTMSKNKTSLGPLDIKLEEADAIKMSIQIKRGIKKIETRRTEAEYNDMRYNFRQVYEAANDRLKATNNVIYAALGVIALSHAGFSSNNAASFVALKERYLDNTLLDYMTALNLRQKMDTTTTRPIERVYVVGDRNGILVASEQTLKERVAQTLAELYKFKKGEERVSFRNEAINIYLGLLMKTKNPHEIWRYTEALRRLGYYNPPSPSSSRR